MTQIYADGVLVYDSRQEEYDLLGLTITTRLNKGGVAEITMPATHPTYGSYTPYKTIVEIYRDRELRFRGRVLYLAEDYDGTRTVTCEGELCFLQDYASAPYSYATTPRAMFRAALDIYNTAVELAKQFTVGEIAVACADDLMLFEAEEPETVLETVTKLLDVCGGYITFTTDSRGRRVINWHAASGTDSTQTIEAGEGLLDFARTGINTELCTLVLPYGAKNTDTGKRLDITAVNDGHDKLIDEEARGKYGTILKVLTWDEVEDPRVLKALAQQYLDEHKGLVISLTVTALDLSFVDKSIESFKLGDSIRVVSKAHGLDERFTLSELTEDLMSPARSSITLGKEVRTLTGLDVAGDASARRGLVSAVAHLKASSSATILGILDRLVALERPTDGGVDNV